MRERARERTMLMMTGPLQPLVKETWLLASVHGPGLHIPHMHTCLGACVCDRESGEWEEAVMLVF